MTYHYVGNDIAGKFSEYTLSIFLMSMLRTIISKRGLLAHGQKKWLICQKNNIMSILVRKASSTTFICQRL